MNLTAGTCLTSKAITKKERKVKPKGHDPIIESLDFGLGPCNSPNSQEKTKIA
jgi:hypothetical protein